MDEFPDDDDVAVGEEPQYGSRCSLVTAQLKSSCSLLSPEARLHGMELAQKKHHAEFQQRIVDSKAWALNDCGCVPFAKDAARGAVEMDFQPLEAIIQAGDPCAPGGCTPYYILLEGKMVVEDFLGVPVGVITAGEMFGTGGALGLVTERQNTMRCAKGKPCVCAQLSSSTLETAFQSAPIFREPMEELYYDRQKKYAKFHEARNEWIRASVVPALLGTPLLAGCPEEILVELAQPLCEVVYSKGKVIAKAGDEGKSMIVLLEGQAEVLGRNGEKFGLYGDGASLGEVAALGLFTMRTTTLRALTRCRVLMVTAEVLQRVAPVKEAFSVLLDSKLQQVKQGLPLTALIKNLDTKDSAVCAISMQAEKLVLSPGDVWEPESDSGPHGLRYAVLGQGRLQVEMADGAWVTNLLPSTLFLEGVVAEFGAKVRAVSTCEIYRVLNVDFLAATTAVASAQNWLYRFRLLEIEARKRMHARLVSMRGVERNLTEHPSDSDIHEWKMRRDRAMARSRRIKKDKLEGPCTLPLLPQFRAPTLDEQLNRYVKGGRSLKSGLSKAHSQPQLTSLPRLCEASILAIQQ